MAIEVVPFHEGLLPAAAELLARRHARDRLAMPLLAARFETTRSALRAVRDVWHRPWTRGAAALREGRLAGSSRRRHQYRGNDDSPYLGRHTADSCDACNRTGLSGPSGR